MDRLKWLRVTDVIWLRNAVPAFNLESLGTVRAITNGVALHLDGPTMERDIRDEKLSIVASDLQKDGRIVIPIGFSPFLRASILREPVQEIALAEYNGYTAIRDRLPVGTGIELKAITPAWLSIALWISVVSSAVGGFLLFALPRNCVGGRLANAEPPARGCRV